MYKRIIKKLNALRDSGSFITNIQAIGGLLILMYIPLLIGLIWFDTSIMLKAIGTNTVLLLGIYIIDYSQIDNK